MPDLIGLTALAIAVVDDSCVVINFIVEWVKNSKAFGADVRVFRTRWVTECAKLKALTDFLRDERVAGSRFDEMPTLQRTAILGMIRELDILFASYHEAIQKHGLGELSKEYISDATLDVEALFIDETKAIAKSEAKAIQTETNRVKVALWGLFEKKKILRLLSSLEWWNDKLMQFMLCCLTLGKQDELARPTATFAGRPVPDDALTRLGAQTGVTLKQLLVNQTAVKDDFFKQNWALQPLKESNDTRLQKLVVGEQKTTVFVEYKPFQLQRRAKEPSDTVKARVAGLAKPLSIPDTVESGFSALQCMGVLRQDIPATRFAFVFRLPDVAAPADPGNGQAKPKTSSTLPISLSATIVSDDHVRPTLNEKFKLAGSLTRSVTQFHSINWVHKSIRSENVLLFPSSSTLPVPNSQRLLEYSHPYLVGFEFSRLASDRSTDEVDDILSRNLYRSPGRWGPPEESFTVLDDIYALGVTLLEIGIWRPLIMFQENFADMSADDVKRCLIQHAEHRLPHYMGEDYTQAVLKCLKGDFGSPDERRSFSPDSVELNMLMGNEVTARIETGVRLE